MSNTSRQTHAEALQALFDEVSALPAQQRDPFLDARCAGDDSLRADVESLLAADEGAGAFLAEPTIASERIVPIPPTAAPKETPKH